MFPLVIQSAMSHIYIIVGEVIDLEDIEEEESKEGMIMEWNGFNKINICFKFKTAI